LVIGKWRLPIADCAIADHILNYQLSIFDDTNMRIAVCVKQVVTREWQVRVNETKTWVRDQDASWELNEPDAYALEEALRLKEKHGGEVVVVSAGPARVTQVIREALARGADRAIHVAGDALAAADAFSTADALAAAIKSENDQVDLVLTGLQSDDQGFAQVGVILAEKLGVSHATIVMEIQASPSTGSGQAAGLRVKRELEGGWFQWIAMSLPAVLTIQSGINQLRYATLKGIMAAKKKEIRTVPAPATSQPKQRIASIYVPEKAKQTRLVTGAPAEAAKELVRLLRDEARVIQ
jgi:electron transfer flavoprotein beta subunit